MKNEVIQLLRKEFALTPNKEVRIDVKKCLINLTPSFKISYSWKIDDLDSNVFLCTYNYKYDKQKLNSYQYFSQEKTIDNCFCVFFMNSPNIPAFKVRPIKAIDRIKKILSKENNKNEMLIVGNLFIESKDIKSIKLYFSNLFNFLRKEKDLYIDSCNNNILIAYRKKQSFDDGKRLIGIAKDLNEILNSSS